MILLSLLLFLRRRESPALVILLWFFPFIVFFLFLFFYLFAWLQQSMNKLCDDPTRVPNSCTTSVSHQDFSSLKEHPECSDKNLFGATNFHPFLGHLLKLFSHQFNCEADFASSINNLQLHLNFQEHSLYFSTAQNYTDAENSKRNFLRSSLKLKLIPLQVPKLLRNKNYQHFTDSLNLLILWSNLQLIIPHWNLLLLIHPPLCTMIQCMLTMNVFTRYWLIFISNCKPSTSRSFLNHEKTLSWSNSTLFYGPTSSLAFLTKKTANKTLAQCIIKLPVNKN